MPGREFMPAADSDLFIAHLAVLFGLWTPYVAFAHRAVMALPGTSGVLLHEAIRLAVFGVVPLYWACQRSNDPARQFGLLHRARSIVPGLVVGLAFAGMVIGVGVLVEHRPFRPAPDRQGFWTAGLSCATLVEELSFRSFLLGAMTFRREWVGIAWSSVAFAAIHLPGWLFLATARSPVMLVRLFLPVLVLGVILGILFLRTRSYWGVVLVHALNNLAAASLGAVPS